MDQYALGDLAPLVMSVIVGTAVYLIPTFLAHGKVKSHEIFLLNMLAGWTVIGWVAALVWALADKPKTKSATAS
jgi:hypothetical protein